MKTPLVTSTRMPQRLRRWTLVGIVIIVALGLVVAVLAALPALSPGTGASMADKLRAVIGVEPVALLESASFRVEDAYNQFRYRLTGGQPQITWADVPPTPVPETEAPTTQASTQKSSQGGQVARSNDSRPNAVPVVL